MFCPKCGQQQTSGEMRFCPRCGLKLNPVRACLPGEDDAAHGTLAVLPVPRHGDINAGVLIVFLSVLLTSAFVAFANVPLAGAVFVLLLIAAPLLAASGRLLDTLRSLLSDEATKAVRVGVRPREVGFGALLMLVCTALSLCAGFSSGHYGPYAFFAVLAASLPVLLIWSQTLMRATQKLFTAEASIDTAASEPVTSALPGRAASGNALPPAAAAVLPASLFDARREATTAEMGSPPSVTERTTNLLGGD